MELYSESIENAVASWKVVQGLPDYKTLVGELLFRAIFTIAPGAVNLYGFGEGVDPYDMPDTLFKLPAFQAHTNRVVTMLETALVMMLGEDMESLALTLSQLGAKHVNYGIQPPHYIIVESALVRTPELGLGDSLTLSLRKDWEAVFRFVSRAMMMGAEKKVKIVKSQRRTAEHKKVETLRLNAISQGKRSKALTRDSRTRFSRFEAGSPNPRYQRRSSDPPQRPVRKRLDESTHYSRSSSDLQYVADLAMNELETVDSTGATVETLSVTSTEHDGGGCEPDDEEEDYWSWWNDTNVEPPKIPQRVSATVVMRNNNESSLLFSAPPRRSSSHRTLLDRRNGNKPTPPLLVRHGSFDSVSTMGSHDSAPSFPRRRRSPSPPPVVNNASPAEVLVDVAT